ncbi:hypothetical protein [Bradyrhizobium manausense]|uniref:Lipoprotein n=1 Tax=Bradyrhizobium manausense TaxID=989370 RepID=A0A0R3E723_9BRAD|nr:hypothetical protein [Bradyrhizobium manausense]KRQ15330.1 hypothetical protein AOQ71_10040 [Bradyrhizobium manausense]
MVARNLLALVVVSGCVAGCGTYVPEIQENLSASESERSAFIQAIVRNVRCEVQDAVVRLYQENPPSIDPYNRNLKWFDSWAVQISLQLTIDEKGILNPTGNWLPPSPANSIFNLAAGATVSTEAQRVDKIGAFFLVSELKKLRACPPQDRNRGPFILQSDLKLFQWLKATMISIDNGDTPAPADSGGPLQSNVLSHEVKFDIVSTGTLNPGWVLTMGSINQNGTFLSATRDRTQDLTITFGPPDPKWAEFVIDPVSGKRRLRPAALGPAASNAALASEIGASITNAVRSGARP